MEDETTKEGLKISYQLEIDRPYVKVYAAPEGKFVYAQWFGLPPLEKIKTGCNDMIDVLSKHKYEWLISDTSQVKGTWTGAMEWLMTEWWGNAITAGLRRLAFIYPPDVFAKYSVDSFVKKGNKKDNPIDQNAFGNKEDAIEWVRNG